jgi:hypothetical protein
MAALWQADTLANCPRFFFVPIIPNCSSPYQSSERKGSVMKNARKFWLGSATAALALMLSPAVWAGASSGDSGNGDPSGHPGIFGTSPSPAANPDSPGAGPHSGPSDNQLNPVTGHYTPEEIGTHYPSTATQYINTTETYHTRYPYQRYPNDAYEYNGAYNQNGDYYAPGR